jgi:hypothetical protein
MLVEKNQDFAMSTSVFVSRQVGRLAPSRLAPPDPVTDGVDFADEAAIIVHPDYLISVD